MATIATEVTRVCKACGIEKPIDEFGKHSGSRNGRLARCRACKNEGDRQRRLAMGPEFNARRRARRKRYPSQHPLKKSEWQWQKNGLDMTAERYQQMLEEQEGLCALCGRPETMTRKGRRIRLAVDHCHSSMRVRGLLCLSCNVMLGKIERDDMLARILAYLVEHESPSLDLANPPSLIGD